MPDRIAFRMNLNPGQAAEYEKRHDEIFPELVTLLKEVGISDYTIWLDPEDHHLFASSPVATTTSSTACPTRR